MALPSSCTNSCAQKVVLFLLALLLLLVYISKHKSSLEDPSSPPSCPCHCNCFQNFMLRYPLEHTNSSYEGCGENDPELNEEMKKDMTDLLLEEVALLKEVAKDTLERTKSAIRGSGEGIDRFKREVEKCSGLMESCEAWRERAEADIADEIKLTQLWEQRARQLGWRNFND